MRPPEPKGAACPRPPRSPRSPLSSTATTGSPQGPSSPSLPHDPRHLRPGLGSLRGARSRRVGGVQLLSQKDEPPPPAPAGFFGEVRGEKTTEVLPEGEEGRAPPAAAVPPSGHPGVGPRRRLSLHVSAASPPGGNRGLSPALCRFLGAPSLCSRHGSPLFSRKRGTPNKKRGAPKLPPPPPRGCSRPLPLLPVTRR